MAIHEHRSTERCRNTVLSQQSQDTKIAEAQRLEAEGWFISVSGGPAPPAFSISGRVATPIDIRAIELRIIAEVPKKRAYASACIHFTPFVTGRPFFDFVYQPDRLRLNGVELPAETLREITTPDGGAVLRLLDVGLTSGQESVLELEYAYPVKNNTICFTEGGVRLAFFMDDRSPRQFLEAHAPANLEFDQFAMTVDIELRGATNPHKLFTNGVSELFPQQTRWSVKFPEYFTSSSFYLHLTDSPFCDETRMYKSIDPNHPFNVTVYDCTASSVGAALDKVFDALEEFERTYGAFPHDRLVVYMAHPAGGAGMEYCGAAVTGYSALKHELLHSWFARGVMPANGNSGWIDEAIAMWHAHGYQQADPNVTYSPVNLAGFSPYRRHTPEESYRRGALLLSQLDDLLQEGLRPVLRKFFDLRKRQVVTTPEFLAFLEAQPHSGDFNRMFRRYVYGQPEPFEFSPRLESTLLLQEAWGQSKIISEPRPYTLQELRQLL